MAYFGQRTIVGSQFAGAKPKKSKPLILWIHITCMYMYLETTRNVYWGSD